MQARPQAAASPAAPKPRRCPYPDCRVAISGGMFSCSKCWQNVPNEERSELAAAFHDYRDNLISSARLEEVREQIAERLTGVPSDAGPIPQTITCRRCGKTILVALGLTGGPVGLDQVRNSAEQNVARCGGTGAPLLVVVAGKVSVDTGSEGHPESLARFRFHPCTSPVRFNTREQNE